MYNSLQHSILLFKRIIYYQDEFFRINLLFVNQHNEIVLLF